MNKRLSASMAAVGLCAAGLIAFAPAASAAPSWAQLTLPDAGKFTGMAVDSVHGKIYVGVAFPHEVHVIGMDGTLKTTITGIHVPSDLTMAPDGSAAYVAEFGKASLTRVDAATDAVERVALPDGHCPVALAPSGGKVWYSYRACGTTGELSLASFDPATGASAETGLTLDGEELRAHPNRPDRLLTMNTTAAGGMRVYDVSGTPAEIARIDGVGCFDAAFVSGGDELVAACAVAPNGHRVFTTADLGEKDSLPGNGTPTSVAAAPGGTFIGLGTDASAGPQSVEIRSLEGGLPGAPRNWVPGKPHADGMRFTDDGALVTVKRASYEIVTITPIPAQRTTWITSNRTAPIDYQGQVTVSGVLHNGPTTGGTVQIERVHQGVLTELGPVPVAPDGTFSYSEPSAGRTGRVTYRFVFLATDEFRSSSSATGVSIGVLPFDFNGDGFPEAVSGAPYEDTGSSADTGQVTVFPGGAEGVSTAGVIFDQDTPEVSGSNEIDDRFGSSFASGDFDMDGYADLAVGVPGEDNDAFNNGGAVILLYGSVNGLTARSRMLARDVAGAEFGRSVAAGDFDGDGRDDLAVGAPGEGAGKVVVYEGGYSELNTNPVNVLDQNSADVPGTNASGDRFGWSLASGDIDGDGRFDLAVGAPQDSEDKGWSTGSVTLFHGTTDQATLTGAQRVTKETEGVPGAAGPRNPSTGDGADEFGLKLAMGDFNGDGRDDLAIAAPGTHVKNAAGVDQPDAGSVTILYSDGAGLGTAGATEITQLSGSVFGAPADNDFFGDTLAAGDSNGDGADELAVFSYGDDRVWVTPGSTSGLVLATTTAWNQDTPGIPGSAEAGDKWGASLRFIAGAKPALLVGAPGEDAQQGAFTVVYGGPGGLTAAGATYFGEDTPGVPGTAENGDRFGTF